MLKAKSANSFGIFNNFQSHLNYLYFTVKVLWFFWLLDNKSYHILMILDDMTSPAMWLHSCITIVDIQNTKCSLKSGDNSTRILDLTSNDKTLAIDSSVEFSTFFRVPPLL